MRLHLYRVQYLPTCTKGNLYVNGQMECFTLEPPLRSDGKINIPNLTCILECTCAVIRNAASKFGRNTPLLVDVPGRANIEMHPLNLPSQTDGCIGVGKQWINAPEIGQSDLAFSDLTEKLEAAWDAGESVILTVDSLFEVPHV